MKATKEWISISDMMTGLMMVFLFISILFMYQVQEECQAQEQCVKKSKELSKEINAIMNKHQNYKKIIAEELNKEFQEDLKKWNASIPEKDPLTIRFLSPDIMFEAGSSVIKKEFRDILSNFCPRYFKILYERPKKINEVRIEGHTSKEWAGSLSEEDAYFNNMSLSQERTRSVLQYCVIILNSIDKNIKEWMIRKLTANGLSSSRPVEICIKDSVKCRSLNRRVEFRISVNEFDTLNEVIKTIKDYFFYLNNKSGIFSDEASR